MKRPARKVEAAAGSTRGVRTIPAIVFAVLATAMFIDVVVSDKFDLLGHERTDMDRQFLAWRGFGFGEMRHGNLPLWNPHVFCGAPFLGGTQSALLYPPNLLFLVLPLKDAVNLSIILHVVLLGALTYLWARRRGLSVPSALLSGTVLMFGGTCFPHLYAGHLPNLCTMAWAPLLLLAIDGLLEGPSLRWPLLGALAAAMQILAGHSQYMFYTGVAAALYFLLRLKACPRRVGAILGFLGIYLAAAALTAAQLLTSLDVAGESARGAGLAYKAAASFSFPPENLLTTVAPAAFGEPADKPPHEYWGRGIWWETSLFVGAAALVLAVYGALHGPKGQRLRPILMVALLLLLAVGQNTPLFRFLYDYVPGFRQFRGISKFVFQASLFLGLLAGMGFEACRRRGWTGWRGPVVVAGAAVLLAAGALAVHLASTAPDPAAWTRLVHATWEEGTTRSGGPSLAVVLSAGRQSSAALLTAAGVMLLAALCLAARRFTPRATWAILVLAFVELFVFARSHRPTLDAYKATHPGFCAAIAAKPPGDWRVCRTALHNEPMLGGYCDLWGSDPVVMRRYSEWISHTQGLPHDQGPTIGTFIRGVPGTDKQFLSLDRLYCMLRLHYAVDTPSRIVTVPDPMPRLNLLTDYLLCPDRESAFAALDNPAFDPRRTVILETEPSIPGLRKAALPPASAPASAPASMPQDSPGTVELVNSSTDCLTIKANLSAPAVLLVTDAYARGWRIRAAPGSARSEYRVQPGNYCLRAVVLPPGEHRFVMEYSPAAFRTGVWISLASLAAYGALWAWCLFTPAAFAATCRGRRRPWVPSGSGAPHPSESTGKAWA